MPGDDTTSGADRMGSRAAEARISVEDVDHEARGWLRRAYDANA